ncbi:hypothetical protein PISMIDRAFT_31175 [Pisolithus microcarpus 441]|uniref:Uncharacterized protein n=1 Tax=Pisolithus microcarpus 441 TaxID=765257 RepID=A0A0C9YI56_9AGAM|nr:hypothetical protein BKA83DRAFT_31175 [Pisolithus microcarpus]KIK13459.1 hypothetical protein PISMIDRAFT_31175 [Pisolithus microcarpus 441]
MSQQLPATQVAPAVAETMEDSDDPMPDYKRKRRSKAKLSLQENVRRHAVHLLKRKSRWKPFPKVASPKETVLYAATGQGGPTVENFCLDFHGPLASAWNKRATDVFASHFFDCGWYGSPRKDDIKRAFETHMRTLRAQYANLHADAAADDEQSQIKHDEEKEKARAQRRRSLRHRRANACSAHMDLARFSSLWATLPPDAMSGDETDHQPGQKRYAITKLSWRSQAATEWLRVFDPLHLSTRFNSNGRAKRGALPHTRIPSRRVEMSSQPVPRLPSNFYDAAWLLTLDDDAKAKLKMLPEVDLMHTPAVLA